MNTKRSCHINEFIDHLNSQASMMPNGVFAMQLRALMWPQIALGATLKDPIEVKRGLLSFLKEYTWSLDNPKTYPDQNLSYQISEPTRRRYLSMLNGDGSEDYNKRTFNNLFNLVAAEPLKNFMSISQFWWRFFREYYLEGLAMIADTDDPLQSHSEPFWVVEYGEGSAVMIKLNILRFAAIFGATFRRSSERIFSIHNKSFNLYSLFEYVKSTIDATLSPSVAELDDKLMAG
jgi:hypothetical protein